MKHAQSPLSSLHDNDGSIKWAIFKKINIIQIILTFSCIKREIYKKTPNYE